MSKLQAQISRSIVSIMEVVFRQHQPQLLRLIFPRSSLVLCSPPRLRLHLRLRPRQTLVLQQHLHLRLRWHQDTGKGMFWMITRSIESLLQVSHAHKHGQKSVLQLSQE